MTGAGLLDIANLRVGFPVHSRMAEAVRDVNLSIQAGEAVGLVGESGSGKSVTALSVMRLISLPGRILSGTIRFKGTDLLALPEREVRQIRGRRISMIFQDPLTALNPAFTVGQQLVDVIRTHQGIGPAAARDRAIETLATVDIPSPAKRLSSYPHELSGGMRQRVLIAMAVVCRPELLIADEPTTALDMTVQAQVIALLRQLRRDLGLAVLFITHNLDLVAELCDRVAVMYAGMVVEEASVEQLFSSPRHPYTRALMRCVPRLTTPGGSLSPIDGLPPELGITIPGCPFEPRCPLAIDRCRSEVPPESLSAGHRCACWAAGTS